MGKYVGNYKDRIIFLFANANIHCAAVLFADNTVNGKRQGKPLVLLDSAVVVGVKVDNKVAFVDRVLLYVQTGRVYVGAKNVHALFQAVASYVKEGNGLSKLGKVNLVPCLYLFKRIYVLITILFCFFYKESNAFPLSLSLSQKILVSTNQFIILCHVFFSLHFLVLKAPVDCAL